MIPATAYHLALALETAAERTSPPTVAALCANCIQWRQYKGHLSDWGACKRHPFMTPSAKNWTCTEHEPMPKKPIPIPKGYKLKDGKLIKVDTAPPHVRAGRRRKANKVTGVRAAK